MKYSKTMSTTAGTAESGDKAQNAGAENKSNN
jgi:hypothetical protein